MRKWAEEYDRQPPHAVENNLPPTECFQLASEFHTVEEDVMSKQKPGSSRLSHEAENIRQATASYERWMRCCKRIIASDLRLKHE